MLEATFAESVPSLVRRVREPKVLVYVASPLSSSRMVPTPAAAKVEKEAAPVTERVPASLIASPAVTVSAPVSVVAPSSIALASRTVTDPAFWIVSVPKSFAELVRVRMLPVPRSKVVVPGMIREYAAGAVKAPGVAP